MGRLSKGERQIFILALYWAIIEISGQNIPFVIDTPYARRAMYLVAAYNAILLQHLELDELITFRRQSIFQCQIMIFRQDFKWK